MSSFQDIFISYGRADSKAFCIQLYQALVEHGFTVWFDQHDIPPSVDYQKQIDDGLETSDNFLFIMAPHSVNSAYCRKEIDLAVQRHKRIIPIMHVPEISEDVWQKRYFDQSLADCQTKGLRFGDTRNQNLHPAIAPINWIWCLNEADFQGALAKIVVSIETNRDYVRQHTRLLAKALYWERHQRHSRYLLVGEARVAAETWLKIRFDQSQAPCLPTDLHCEYVCESIKNANGLMTQVFISYGEADKDFMWTIAHTLMREGLTVWTNKTDIQSGVDFQETIKQGIAEADNVVYLMSPDAAKSEYCQQELNYALSLNKRIIPLLITPTPLSDIPTPLRGIQYIDFTDNQNEVAYRKDTDELLRVLQQDATYYAQHKILLAKALKWSQQNRNASVLLRGYSLEQAKTWLTNAQGRSLHPPLPIHTEFITESNDQPKDAFQEVFISYSRVDSDFAYKLNDALQMQGKTTWFDQESIASGIDFQQEIYRGIENSHNVLFIISPSAINFPYCAGEVDHAVNLNKRIITVLYRPVDPADLHPALAAVQCIDFTLHGGDFYTNFSELTRTLDIDREHVRDHTKWSQRSREWEQDGNNPDLLLRGSEFTLAETWLQGAETDHKQPPPTDLQRAYLQASRAAIAAEVLKEQRINRLLRIGLVAVSGLAVAALFASGIAFNNQRQAIRNEIEALASSSEANFALGNHFEALLQGLRAAAKLDATWLDRNNSGLRAKVMTALQKPLYQIREQNKLDGHEGAVTAMTFSADGQIIGTASTDGTAKLWKRDGKEICTFTGHKTQVNAIAFSPNTSLIATASQDRTARLWNPDCQETAILRGQDAIVKVAFSPRDGIVATLSNTGTARLWRLDGSLIETLATANHADQYGTVLTFSPNGNYLVTGGDNGATLWQIEAGGKENSTKIAELPGSAASAAFSRDEAMVAIATYARTVTLWQSSDGTPLQTLGVEGNDNSDRGHTDWVNTVAISRNGQWIASGSDDQTVILWFKKPNETFFVKYKTLFGHTDIVNDVGFSPDGKIVASASADGTVKLWQATNGTLVATLNGHTDVANQVRFSPTGDLIATASDDRTVRLWQPSEPLMTTLNLNSDPIYSPTGDRFITNLYDGPLQLWGIDGREIKTLLPREFNAYAAPLFSPNGKTLVTSDIQGKVQLWDVNGREIKTLIESNRTDWQYSADGERIAIQHNYANWQLWNADGTKIRDFENTSTITFSNQGHDYLITSSMDGLVQIYNGDGELISTLIERNPAEPPSVEVQFSPDDQRVWTKIAGGAMQLWRTNGQLLTTLMETSAANSQAIFSPDWQSIVLVEGPLTSQEDDPNLTEAGSTSPQGDRKTTYGPIYFWNLQPTGNNNAGETEQQFVRTTLLEKIERQSNEVLSVQFSPDSKIVAATIGYPPALDSASDQNLSSTNNPPGKIVLWRTDGSKITAIEETLAWINLQHFNWFEPDPAQYTDPLLFNAQHESFITPGQNGSIKLWGYDGQMIAELVPKSEDPSTIYINPEDRTITVDSEGVVKFVKLSADGQAIVTASSDEVKLWQPNGTVKTTLPGIDSMKGWYFDPDAPQKFVDFSADNSLLAIKDLKTIKLFQLNGESVDEVQNNSDIQEWIFSPDNNRMAAVGKDGVIELWDRHNRSTTELAGKAADAFTLRFSPDNNVLISIRDDRTRSLRGNNDPREITIRQLTGMMTLDDLRRRGCDWIADYLQANVNSPRGGDRHNQKRDRNLCRGIR